MSTSPESYGEQPEQGPTIRDKRRIDPQTGALREQATMPAPAAPAAATDAAPAPPTAQATDEIDVVRQQLGERTADLQRLSAEYANYRRRVDRDRQLIQENAVANVLTGLLEILDDIGRARDHGELEGGFKAVADALEAMVGKLGLERYGTEGEPFDPMVHEALMHSESDDVTEATCAQILQPGYRLGQRILRPARVAVSAPSA